MRPTVVVVDDHEEFRATARDLLVAGGWRVVAESGDAAGALEAVRMHQPDLVLLDVGLAPGDPGGDGIDVAYALAGLPLPPAVVLVSGRSAKEYGTRLDQAPVLGFIPKVELSGPVLGDLLNSA